VVQGCHPEGRTPAAAAANRLDLAPSGATCDFEEHDWMIGRWG